MKTENSILDNRLASTLIFIFILALVGATWFWLPGILAVELTSLTERGQFGDSYGAVTSLFTGLAFAGLLFTILLQQREIKLQRQDFINQLKEMQLSRKEAERQSQLQEQQIRIGEVQLRMKPLEVQIELIRLESLQWVESARHGMVGKKLEHLQHEMEVIIGSFNKK